MKDSKSNTKLQWKGYLFELLSVFIGVTLAFMLNKWNEDRKEEASETNILKEIRNGLKLDLTDLDSNIHGHNQGIEACKFFRKLIDNKIEDKNSHAPDLYVTLLRDFISVQNISAYEALKSNGLETITNDSLRFQIIEVYDFDYEILKKFEEEYYAMQYNQKYADIINEVLLPFMEFDEKGVFIAFKRPIKLSEKDKKRMLLYLWQIEYNRKFNIQFYYMTKGKVEKLIENINAEIKSQ